KRILRSEITKTERKSAEERNGVSNREGAGRVPTRRPDIERGRSFGAAQRNRGSSGSNALLVEIRSVHAQKVRGFAIHSRQRRCGRPPAASSVVRGAGHFRGQGDAAGAGGKPSPPCRTARLGRPDDEV